MEFVKTATNGFPVAIEELSDVSNAAVSELAGFGRCIESTVAFAEGMKNLLHGPFDIGRILGEHGGILPVFPGFLCRCRRLPCKCRAKKAKWGS
jgi:hypothetical protein